MRELIQYGRAHIRRREQHSPERVKRVRHNRSFVEPSDHRRSRNEFNPGSILAQQHRRFHGALPDTHDDQFFSGKRFEIAMVR